MCHFTLNLHPKPIILNSPNGGTAFSKLKNRSIWKCLLYMHHRASGTSDWMKGCGSLGDGVVLKRHSDIKVLFCFQWKERNIFPFSTTRDHSKLSNKTLFKTHISLDVYRKMCHNQPSIKHIIYLEKYESHNRHLRQPLTTLSNAIQMNNVITKHQGHSQCYSEVDKHFTSLKRSDSRLRYHVFFPSYDLISKREYKHIRN